MKHALSLLFLAALVTTGIPSQAHGQTIVATTTFQHAMTITTTTDVTIAVAGNLSPNPRDFLGLYLPTAKTYSQMIDWAYLNDTALKPLKGMAAGTAKFNVEHPGEYQIRWYRLTDQGVATLIKTIPLAVVLTPVELTGPTAKVVRNPTNEPDVISIVIEGDKAVLVAPKDTVVTLKPAVAKSKNKEGP